MPQLGIFSNLYRIIVMLQRVVLLLFLFLSQAFGQDETYFRSLLSGDILKEGDLYKLPIKNHYFVSSPLYYLDMNNDLKNEGILLKYVDGDHKIEIYNHKKEKIYSYTFQSKGIKAQVHRIRFVDLGMNKKGLILYFFEGISKHVETYGSGRIYLLSWGEDKFEEMRMNSGPLYWMERKDHIGRYYKRRYQVGTKDIDGDGLKEIVVSSGTIRHILRRLPSGEWKPLVY